MFYFLNETEKEIILLISYLLTYLLYLINITSICLYKIKEYYICLNSNYHNALTFSFDILDGAVREYQKMKNKTLILKNDGQIAENPV